MFYSEDQLREYEDDNFDDEEVVPAFTKRRLEVAFENQLIDLEFDEAWF